jgi:hypothetical protein
MESVRSAKKYNTVSNKQHDLLNNKTENNTVMKIITYQINPTS